MSQRLRLDRPDLQRKSKWRLAAFLVVGVIGAALLVILVAFLLILRTTPPPVIHTNPATAQRLQRELQEAQKAAETGTQATVHADETELNSLLRQYLGANPSMASAENAAVLRDIKVNLTEDRLRLYLLANFKGKDLTFVLEGRVTTEKGFLDFEPVSGKIGSLPIPKASLQRAVEQVLATPETRELMRLPSNLRDLHVENGKLIVVFK